MSCQIGFPSEGRPAYITDLSASTRFLTPLLMGHQMIGSVKWFSAHTLVERVFVGQHMPRQILFNRKRLWTNRTRV